MGRKIRRDHLADTDAAYPTVEEAILADLSREEAMSDLHDLVGSPLDVDYFWQ
jgi:hypothetical protein